LAEPRARAGLLVIASFVVAGLGCRGEPKPTAPTRPQGFDPAPWRADYLELRDALGAGYANLEWMLAHRGIDPFALNQRTLAAIDAARSDLDGLWALAELVATFGDPHLRLDVQEHPVYGVVTRYPLRLVRRGGSAEIAEIAEIDAPGCALRPGDEVTALDGRAIGDEQRRYRRLVGYGTEARALDKALRLAVSSPFAPRDGRIVEGRHGGAVISCRLSPVTAPTSQPTSQPAQAPRPDALDWSSSGADACKALGFRRGSFAFSYPLPVGAERVDLGDGELPAAVVTTPAGARVGLLRIASFQDEVLLDACAATWERLRPRQHTERCERACQEQLGGAVRQEIGDRFAAVVAALAARGVAALAIDITGNGGGNDWVEDVARMLSEREPGCGKQAVIRHPHWSRRYGEGLGALEQLLAGGRLAEADRALVVRDAEHARRMLAATTARCDLRPWWTRPGYRPGCSLLAPDEGALCGREAARLDELTDPPGPAALVWDRAPPRVGLYRGPLFVLMDDNTASAAEQLVNRLKMAGRGVLLGRRTLGAGCGYTNGGLDVVLGRSRLRVRMPDCVRYLASGDNEVAGIAPDVPLAADATAPAFLDEALAAMARTLAAGRRPIQPGAGGGS
jgi:hypothetical protein